jgi:hypothetical protein
VNGFKPDNTFAMRCLHALRPLALAALLLSACGVDAVEPVVSAYPNTEGFGVEFSKSEDWYQQCMRLAPPPPPAPRAGSQRCKASDLYYLKRDQETTSNAEWRQVRECAQASGDDAVLMMLYANGYGVARDAGRAIHYACRLDTAKAEMEARISYLASAAAVHDTHPFDLCDHITSGRMGAVCAGISEGRADQIRHARIERFAARLPAQARTPFARLRAAAKAFTRKTADEADMNGTGAAGFALEDMGRRDEEFMETLLKAASGALPRASAAQLAQLDLQLNAIYRELLGKPSEDKDHPERLGYSTVAREDVRSTERVWLAYRDAWEPFLAATRLPVDLISVKAALTRQRIAQLKRI